MQAGIIIRGFIASPSDVTEERKAALDVVTRWNAVNSLDRDMVIEAVRVETHAESQLGQHPQKIINKTLLERCDFLIAVFWSKLGTPTGDAVSGTAEEIDEFSKAKGGDKVKLFFSERDIPHNHDKDQFAALQAFKKQMQEKSLYIPFTTIEDFAGKLRDQLDIVMNKIDRSETKEKLWSEHAKLTELDKIEVERARYNFESAKQRGEDLRGIRRGIVAVHSLKLALPESAKLIMKRAWTSSNSRTMFARGGSTVIGWSNWS